MRVQRRTGIVPCTIGIGLPAIGDDLVRIDEAIGVVIVRLPVDPTVPRHQVMEIRSGRSFDIRPFEATGLAPNVFPVRSAALAMIAPFANLSFRHGYAIFVPIPIQCMNVRIVRARLRVG